MPAGTRVAMAANVAPPLHCALLKCTAPCTRTSRAPDGESAGGTTAMQLTAEPVAPPAASPGAGSARRCSRGSCTSGIALQDASGRGGTGRDRLLTAAAQTPCTAAPLPPGCCCFLCPAPLTRGAPLASAPPGHLCRSSPSPPPPLPPLFPRRNAAAGARHAR